MNCGLIILAAGNSDRLGKPKQLLEYEGKSLLHHTIQTALGAVARVVVVLGAKAHLVLPELKTSPVQVVYNTDWEEGMASSIGCGLNALLTIAPATEQVLFMVCDQPYVTADLLLELRRQHAITGKPIVACSYGNTTGIPALFHKSLFAELMTLTGDTGAKKLIRRYAEQMVAIPFPKGAIDIDTSADYDQLHKTTI